MTLLRSKRFIMLSTVFIAGSGYTLWPHQEAVPATKGNNSAPLVSLVSARVKPLPLLLTTQGHVISLNQVDIQPQLTGTVKSVDFKEGAFVHKNDLLFTLNDATQQATLSHAIAAKAEIEAQLNKARNDAARGQRLRAKNYISASDWDTLQSNVALYNAQYRAAQDDIHTAQVQLSYTRITAPVSGKTGALNVHPGSLVQPGSTTPMVSINQFDPIGVSFTLPEQSLPPVISAQNQEPVHVMVTDASGKAITGTLDFIDNAVSTDSGTITLKAHFSNAQHLLWPGMYQSVIVDAGVKPLVVLPPQAVQNGPDGHFVFVVNSQNRVDTKLVNLVRIQQDMAVIDGLAAGSEVVAEGANKLRPGMTVSLNPHRATMEQAQ